MRSSTSLLGAFSLGIGLCPRHPNYPNKNLNFGVFQELLEKKGCLLLIMYYLCNRNRGKA